MTYQSSINAVAVTAMNILDGLDHHKHWDQLQLVWEDEDMGFVEFCAWIGEIAEESERLLTTHDPQSFSGVYDYEVSCELGEWILNYMTRNNRLPPDEEWKHTLIVLFEKFFKQGEKQ